MTDLTASNDNHSVVTYYLVVLLQEYSLHINDEGLHALPPRSL